MDLVVRVRAAGDSSLTSVFRPLVAASVVAGKQVAANVNAGVAAEVAGARKVKSEKEKAIAELAKIRERENNQILRDVDRIAAAEEKAQARATKAAKRGAEERGSAALRTFGGYLRAAGGLAKDVGAGFGIDFSLQGGLSRGMQRNSAAIALSNSAYRGGARENVAGLEDLAMKTGSKLLLDPTGVIQGLTQYQKLTGDLATGKAGLEGLSALAGATGTKLEDMFAAAGNVGNALGEVGREFKTPLEKAKAIEEVMRGVAAFGQEGAVEISDLSAQMAKVAAASGFFEGDRSANLLKMTALAQLARGTGGAASATQAATSVVSFANIMRTPARRRQFEAAGVDIDSKTQVGQLRDPIAIIKDALTKTGGAIEPMKKLFANVLGDKPVTALATAYNQAGGGEKGMKAVDAMLAKFGGRISDEQIKANNAERMAGKEAQGVAFQIELDKVTSALGTELAPALREIAPIAIDVARGLSAMVSFGAQHPGIAITAALVASIGKAAIGESVGRALGSALGSIGPAGLAVGALAVAAAAAAAAIIDYTGKVDAERAKYGKDTELIAKAEKQFKETGKIDKETIDQIAMRRAEVEGAKGTLATGGVEQMSYEKLLWAKVTGGADQIGNAEANTTEAKAMGAEKIDALAAKFDALIAAYKDSKPKGPLDVNIVGGAVTAPAGPAVNTAAQSGGVN